jgi:hypothetical protein
MSRLRIGIDKPDWGLWFAGDKMVKFAVVKDRTDAWLNNLKSLMSRRHRAGED